jgi:hypothetical protein
MLFTELIISLPVIAQTDDPRVYEVFIPNGAVDGVYIYDAITSRRVGLVPIADISASGVEVNPSQTFAVVKSFDSKSNSLNFTGIQIIDLKTQKTTGVVLKGKRIFETEFNPLNELEVLVGLAESDFSNPQIGILNVVTGELSRTVTLPGFPISFNFSTNKMYVLLDRRFEQGVDRLLEMDLGAMTALRGLDLPPSNQEFGVSDQSTITPDGKLIYIGRTNQVVVVNTDRFTFETPVTFDRKEVANIAVAVTDKFRKLYVGEFGVTTLIVDLNTGGRRDGNSRIPDFVITSNNKLFYDSVTGDNIEYETIVGLQPSAEDRPRQGGFLSGVAVAGDFDRGTPPSVKIFEPANGQTVRRGSILKIRWRTEPGTRPLDGFRPHIIELSIDGGKFFRRICNRFSCFFVETANEIEEVELEDPLPNTKNAQLRITSLDTLAGVGVETVTFEIGDEASPPPDTVEPTVTFLQPVMGSRFTPGQTLTATWVSRDNVAVTNQDLSLSLDGGQTFVSIVTGGLGGNVQTLTFQLPNVEVADARLRLVVKDAAGNIGQAVSQSFQIQPALDIEPPRIVINPLENVVAGSRITVNWMTTDDREVQRQEIALSLDGGKNYHVISSLPANASNFVLSNITGIDKTSNQALIRISAVDKTGNQGQAILSFNIVPIINNVRFNKPTLTIMGIGFVANNPQASIKILINGQFIDSSHIMVMNNNLILLQGSRKKLKLTKTGNNIQILVDNLSSNVNAF